MTNFFKKRTFLTERTKEFESCRNAYMSGYRKSRRTRILTKVKSLTSSLKGGGNFLKKKSKWNERLKLKWNYKIKIDIQVTNERLVLKWNNNLNWNSI